MKTFTTVREAKEFLIDRIVFEAQCEGVSLSEAERKMMYFSETGWTLPDMETVNEAFEEECDMGEYEEKIGALARGYCASVRQSAPSELAVWKNAVRALAREDHYLQVLIESPIESSIGSSSRPFQLILIGIAMGCTVLGAWALWILIMG